MDNIKDILKPKSEDEVKKELCCRLNIEEDISDEDKEYLIKLYHIVSFLKSDKSQGVITYLNFDPDFGWSEDSEELDVSVGDRNIHITQQTLTLNLYSKKIYIRKQINSWKEVYEKTIVMILKNCQKLEDQEIIAPHFTSNWPILNNFGFISNLIAVKCRYGPASFAIVNSDFYKKYKNQIDNQNILKVIVDDTTKGKIIIGRKSKSNEAGIFLVKYKNKYSLNSMGLAKNNYISIDVATN